jgi:methionyl-tRNA synthetase
MKSGQRFGKIDILFRKFEDKDIQPEIDRLKKISGNLNKDVPPPAEAKPRITIDDFSKVELRIARVLRAEKIPKADKLLQLQIEISGEERQIVAGIAKHYAPESLIGKKIVVVANLEPAKIRGLESNGMLLAAESADGELGLLMVDKEIETGARVK